MGEQVAARSKEKNRQVLMKIEQAAESESRWKWGGARRRSMTAANLYQPGRAVA